MLTSLKKTRTSQALADSASPLNHIGKRFEGIAGNLKSKRGKHVVCMLSPLFIGGFYYRQVNGISCRALQHKCEDDPNQGSRRHLFYILRRLLPNTISPAPKISRFSGSENNFMGSVPEPIRSANAPELSKGKITRTNIKASKKAVLFTVPTPA
jgi:hypothetical protein